MDIIYVHQINNAKMSTFLKIIFLIAANNIVAKVR